MVDVTPDLPAIRCLPPLARRILRCRDRQIDSASNILGLMLPRAAYGSASGESLHALWLGPDEWLILGAGEAGELLSEAGEALRAVGAAFVDISHRQQAIAVSGADVESWLATGCPLDLSQISFPIGACTRTLFHKAEIALWRTGAHSFHLEVWRSFATYVEALLADACKHS